MFTWMQLDCKVLEIRNRSSQRLFVIFGYSMQTGWIVLGVHKRYKKNMYRRRQTHLPDVLSIESLSSHRIQNTFPGHLIVLESNIMSGKS